MGLRALEHLEGDSVDRHEMAEIMDLLQLARHVQCHDQAAAGQSATEFWSKTMQFISNSLFSRSDTIFGVCQALGQDLGINANWFRVAFATAVVFNLEYALIAYFGIGALVMISHLVFRSPVAAEPAAVETAPAAIEEPVAAQAPARRAELAEAA